MGENGEKGEQGREDTAADPPRSAQPHDALFKKTFSIPSEASALFQKHLPSALSAELDWESLKTRDGHYVDQDLLKSQSDILFEVQMRDSRDPCIIYVLLEHQSEPLKEMRFRLLKYMCKIWDREIADLQIEVPQTPIVPLVFYIGKNAWNHSLNFSDYFPNCEGLADFMPNFKHLLIDNSGISDEDLQGTPRAKLLTLLMVSHFRNRFREYFPNIARRMNELLVQLGRDDVSPFYHYMFSTLKNNALEEFNAILSDNFPKLGGLMRTAAEELIERGREEERRKNREVVLSLARELLSSGVALERVAAITKLSPEELKGEI